MQPSHRTWIESNGTGPWPCFRCDEPVRSIGGSRGRRGPDFGVIHHDDRNRQNNDLSNLRVLHEPCHIGVHGLVESSAIAASLRERIKAGEFTFLLPSYPNLAKEYGSGVSTVSRAMRQLKDEGVLVQISSRHPALCIPQSWHSRPGLGVYVREQQ